MVLGKILFRSTTLTQPLFLSPSPPPLSLPPSLSSPLLSLSTSPLLSLSPPCRKRTYTFLDQLATLGLPVEALDKMLGHVVEPVGAVRLMGGVAVEALDGHTCKR